MRINLVKTICNVLPAIFKKQEHSTGFLPQSFPHICLLTSLHPVLGPSPLVPISFYLSPLKPVMQWQTTCLSPKQKSPGAGKTVITDRITSGNIGAQREGATVLRPPPSLGHFVKDFTKTLHFYQYSPPLVLAPPF